MQDVSVATFRVFCSVGHPAVGMIALMCKEYKPYLQEYYQDIRACIVVRLGLFLVDQREEHKRYKEVLQWSNQNAEIICVPTSCRNSSSLILHCNCSTARSPHGMPSLKTFSSKSDDGS